MSNQTFCHNALVQRIRAGYAPGARYTLVAKAIGVADATARAAFVTLGWPIFGRGAPPGSGRDRGVDRTAVLEAVAADPVRSLESFGAQFGITRERVRQIIRDAGQKKPMTTRPAVKAAERKAAAEQRRAERKDAMRRKWAAAADMRARGLSPYAIADAMGVHWVLAYRYLAAARSAGLGGEERGT